jgi:hypothetical protein
MSLLFKAASRLSITGRQVLGEALEGVFLGIGRVGLEALARVLGVGQRPQQGVFLLCNDGQGLGKLLLHGLIRGGRITAGLNGPLPACCRSGDRSLFFKDYNTMRSHE